MKFEHFTMHTLAGLNVTIAGNTIIVMQFLFDIPPPPGPPGSPSPSCNSKTVSLGALPPGTYNVNWIYGVPSGIPGGQPQPVETYPFTFSSPAAAPALSGPALIGLLVVMALAGVVMLRR